MSVERGARRGGEGGAAPLQRGWVPGRNPERVQVSSRGFGVPSGWPGRGWGTVRGLTASVCLCVCLSVCLCGGPSPLSPGAFQ